MMVVPISFAFSPSSVLDIALPDASGLTPLELPPELAAPKNPKTPGPDVSCGGMLARGMPSEDAVRRFQAAMATPQDLRRFVDAAKLDNVAITPKPTVAEAPVVVVEQPKPKVAEAPVIAVEAPKPVALEAPVVAIEQPKPVAAVEAPIAVDAPKPAVAQAPIIADIPVVPSVSVVPDVPVVPLEKYTPVAVAAPVAVSAPVAVESPAKPSFENPLPSAPSVTQRDNFVPVVKAAEQPVAQAPVVAVEPPRPATSVEAPAVTIVPPKPVAVEAPIAVDAPKPAVAQAPVVAAEQPTPVDVPHVAITQKLATSMGAPVVVVEQPRQATATETPIVAPKAESPVNTELSVKPIIPENEDKSKTPVDVSAALTAAIAGAPVVAAPVQASSAQAISDVAAASARTTEILETANEIADAVVAQIVVTPSILKGEGEVLIRLKPTVLDGSEITLSAKDNVLSLAIVPATPEAEQIVSANIPQLERALAEHLPTFGSFVISVAKKGKFNETN